MGLLHCPGGNRVALWAPGCAAVLPEALGGLLYKTSYLSVKSWSCECPRSGPLKNQPADKWGGYWGLRTGKNPSWSGPRAARAEQLAEQAQL